jgi:hypothetical protein
MPRVGFETTIPVLERGKKIHALDRAATVIGNVTFYLCYIYAKFCFSGLCISWTHAVECLTSSA